MNSPPARANGADHEPAPGDWLLGKWRLDRLLGSGGMSSVFSATHRNGSRVAIKLLAASLRGNATVQRRFLREGYIANRVEHPGAVRILDDGKDGDRTFLVMELLEGANLEALRKARGGTLPPSEAVWVARNALSILESAHAANIVHRDVKPQNLFLTSSGELKLLDFGIASLRGVPGFTTLTDAASQPGTPGFMAPEQVRGHHDALGPRTDLWALGATLFRLLSGQTVHVASTAGEMMVATATEPPRSLASVCPELPVLLNDTVDRALRLNPVDRWESAGRMIEALDRVSASWPPLECPVLPAELSLEEVTWDTDFEGGSACQRNVDEARVLEAPRTRARWTRGRAAIVLSTLTVGFLAVHFARSMKSEPMEGSALGARSGDRTTSSPLGSEVAFVSDAPTASPRVVAPDARTSPAPPAAASASAAMSSAPRTFPSQARPAKRLPLAPEGSTKPERDLLKRRL